LFLFVFIVFQFWDGEEEDKQSVKPA